MRTHPVPDPRGRRDQSHDPRYLNRVSPLQVPAGQGGRRFALAEGAERLVEFHNNPADELPLLCRTQAPSSPLSTRAERPRPAAPHAVFPQSPRVISAVRRTGPSTPLSSRAESPRTGILSLDYRYYPNVALPSSNRPQHSPLEPGGEPSRPAAPRAVFPQSPRVISAVRRTGPSTLPSAGSLPIASATAAELPH